ncbi:MAG: hypothetical protein ACI87E_000114 [Mariniblastus sp.]|jgi:hypothetical protein
MKITYLFLTILLTGMIALPSFAQDVKPRNEDKSEVTKNFEKPGYSPYAGRNFPTNVYFGDTHLHTSLSGDAFGFGNKLSDEAAFRFATGAEITSASGEQVKLSRPLDFLVIADHAEAYGAMIEVYAGNPTLMTDPTVKRWNKMLHAGGDESFEAVMEMIQGLADQSIPPVLLEKKLLRQLWEKHIAVVERYNEPGHFTAFHGYEWTSHPGGNNLHRVVILRDAADKAKQVVPFSAFDSENPEDLWKWMQAYEEQTGGSILAIPHNGNLSSGNMFNVETFKGNPLTKAYAETRMRWEPLYEVTQIKGDGEAHPLLSPNDEFADYETWDKGNMDLSVLKTKAMLPGEYARSAYKRGLQFERELGANPFKFGMVGSTDSHTSLATAAEENFFGKHSGKEPTPHRWNHPVFEFNGIKVMGWQQAASGYAAVWAAENTREAIFDAMQRKETYATTGSRMTVRFFGGWDFVSEDANNRLPADMGYRKGVPMGGDLVDAPANKSPTFLVAAMKDSMGGNLDRIQIVKGWLDESGRPQEKVHDVVWAGDRKPGTDGKLPPVGNTVNVKAATWTNQIGSPELITVWKDPNFDAAERAFYYARVIEIPTPRWTAYDALRFDINEMSDDVPMTTQERAYTSPIWYTPRK